MKESNLVEAPTTNLSFEPALRKLKDGNRIAREGWNGKGLWLCLVKEWNGNFSGGNLPEDWSVKPFIAIKSIDNGMVPWLPSQTDVLAEDWCVVENNN
jgi:hypothetical protein